MVHEYTFLGKIFCKWLKWHWPVLEEESKRAGNTYKTCRLCGAVVF